MMGKEAKFNVSYRFQPGEGVDSGTRRIVREEIAASMERLKARSAKDRDEAIHEIRKSVKKVRGLLRLLQPGMGETYTREAAAWRGIGCRLSELRDACAIIAVFDDLRGRYPAKVPAEMRGTLLADKRGTERGNIAAVLAGVANELKRANGRLKGWRPEGEGFAAIAPGLKRTYRQGEKALRRAQKDPTAKKLHDLRKRVKAHLYQIRLLGGMWDGTMRRQEARLRKIEEALGEHQNLEVLKARIAGLPGAEAMLQPIDQLQRGLAGRALRESEKAYVEPPSRVAERFGGLWEKWRDS